MNWRGLSYDPSKFFVKGTELAAAIVPGTQHRFAIHETRGGRDEHGYPTLVYRVRDAETVTLEQVAKGAQPAVVAVFDSPEEAISFALSKAG